MFIIYKMSLDKRAVQLALLRQRHTRTMETQLNRPEGEIQEGRSFGGMKSLHPRMVGGSKKQNEEDKENERLGMEVKGLKDYEKKKGGKRGRPRKNKQTEADREHEKIAMEIHEIKKGGKKKRGRPRKVKQTEADKEDERLGEEVHGLEDAECKGGAKGKKAYSIGKDYAKEMLEHDKEMKDLVGGGFFGDFWKGMKEGLGMVATGAKNVLGAIPTPATQIASAGLGALGAGKTGGKKSKPKRSKAGANDKRKRRGALVSKLMREKGMSLGQASKHIKSNPELLE